MTKDTQISAMVSRDTRDRLERLVRATGVKKGHVLEQALRHHLLALAELPASAIIPPRIVVTRVTGERLAERMKSSRKPSQALRDLMAGDGD